MIKMNSYIFLLKETNKKNKNSLEYEVDFIKTLKQSFEIQNIKKTSKKEKRKNYIDKINGNIIFNFDGKENTLDFETVKVNSVTYFDIKIDKKDTEDNIIKILEEFNNKLLKRNNELKKYFIIILSYDSISEYYCNKIYPKLNQFERKLKKLFFTLYTSRFKEKFFETTIPNEVQKNSKKIINNAHREVKLQESIYSLDFSAIKKILFEKTWNYYDETQIKRFLSRNEDLTKLDDEKIRNFITNIHPKNDWERFFTNKQLPLEFGEIISDIAKLRNRVAHSKLFNKSQYNQLKKLLDSAISNIDKAINVTETEDFQKINQEQIEIAFDEFYDSLNKLKNIQYEAVNIIYNSMDNLKETLQDIISNDNLKKILQNSLYNDINEDITTFLQNDISIEKEVENKKNNE